MEIWELDFEWLKVRHIVKNAFNKPILPDLQSILFLIGVQELGKVQTEFTKEEKVDILHIAVCSLLSRKGIYEFIGRDEDAWPHYQQRIGIDKDGVENQEILLKECIIDYFKELNLENGGFDLEKLET
ncbi:hypothetical protein [Portibacter lacus]|uniref:Uncharacterized protein n=1 Tax=Portibacter lacus TaxID=1099794 RepID=A0AA37SPZ4_9BACT|nr:hypothetical protein [Portibacter lacus]GLR17109.1 hypothetical protein GCM10007940_17240 [Portibacter lacus]